MGCRDPDFGLSQVPIWNCEVEYICLIIDSKGLVRELLSLCLESL